MSSPWHLGMDLAAVVIYGAVAGLNAFTSRMNVFYFFFQDGSRRVSFDRKCAEDRTEL